MCGIVGLLETSEDRDLRGRIGAMVSTLSHRGPDDEGVWIDAEAGVALGHRRLSILDLSCAGHQPMVSSSGRYVVVYNGELYNHREMAADLGGEAAGFRGHSDTEVLLAAIERRGLLRTLERSVGMFAFGLWDRRERRLHLVRDRLGIKPLYYGWLGDAFVFASELKAFREHPSFEATIDRGALALYLRHNCVPSPYSIYEGVRKLPPGSVLTLDGSRGGDARPEPWWSPRRVAEEAAGHPFDGSDEEAVDALEEVLGTAVEARLISDVPLGAFLSGGIDSASIVALMQAVSSRPAKTFTMGFEDADYDEADQARRISAHLGTDHTELYVSPSDALAVIPDLPHIYDEPFADSSQIPTFMVSRLARTEVTVALSGDGGDELFAGYNRHLWARRVWRYGSRIPRRLRTMAADGIRSIPPGAWDSLNARLSRLPKALDHRMLGYKLQRLSEILPAESPTDIYTTLASHWQSPERVVRGGTEPPTHLTREGEWADLEDFTSLMQYLDLITYLPDDVLTKVDRASMAVGLEVRVPFLDHRVVELAWRIPPAQKIREGQGKWILRRMLERHLPAEIFEGPKTGFGVPLGEWLRGPLRDWAEALLDRKRLEEEGFFDPEAIRTKWEDHLKGRGSGQYLLWDVLMFQAWAEKQQGVLL